MFGERAAQDVFEMKHALQAFLKVSFLDSPDLKGRHILGGSFFYTHRNLTLRFQVKMNSLFYP